MDSCYERILFCEKTKFAYRAIRFPDERFMTLHKACRGEYDDEAEWNYVEFTLDLKLVPFNFEEHIHLIDKDSAELLISQLV